VKFVYHHRTRAEDVEGVHIRGIVDGLRNLGHAVDVVAPPGVGVGSAAPKPNGVKKKRSSPWSLLARRAPELVFESAEVGYNAYALPSLLKKIRGADAIYERYALFLGAGVAAAEIARLPLILEVNDSAVVNRIRPLHLRAAARRFERYIWQRADAIVTITSYFRDLIIEAGVAPERVHVMPNAVDAAQFATLPDGAPARARLGVTGDVTIGYIGAINFWRRVDLLVRAFARMTARAKLVFVGAGPDEDKARALAQDLGVADRVIFAGRAAHADIPLLLQAMDIACIPHSNVYGSPMKLFEYMAAGRSIVAPWLPPIVEGLGDTGVTFAPLDESRLAAALDALAADPVRRAALGAAARSRALGEFVWSRHAERVVDIARSARI
jgi:glycosyltransferase involved in cell wall biosynthesis